MKAPLIVSIWAGVALYVALGVLGLAALHEGAPGQRYLTTGYGVAYTITARSEKND
jgi:hypothetical protein